jgi:hypothetical protein
MGQINDIQLVIIQYTYDIKVVLLVVLGFEHRVQIMGHGKMKEQEKCGLSNFIDLKIYLQNIKKKYNTSISTRAANNCKLQGRTDYILLEPCGEVILRYQIKLRTHFRWHLSN